MKIERRNQSSAGAAGHADFDDTPPWAKKTTKPKKTMSTQLKLTLGLIFLALLGGFAYKLAPTYLESQGVTIQKTVVHTVEKVVEPDQTGVTLEQYKQIRPRMPEEQLFELIGPPLQRLSTETVAAGYTNVKYAWKGEGEVGANVIVTVQDGFVLSKAQLSVD